MSLRHATHFKSASEFSISIFTMAGTLRQEIETYQTSLSTAERSKNKAELVNQILQPTAPEWQKCFSCSFEALLGSCLTLLGQKLQMTEPYPTSVNKDEIKEVFSYSTDSTKMNLLELIAQDKENPLANKVRSFIDRFHALSNSQLSDDIKEVSEFSGKVMSNK